jgi:hypothetical protein
VAKYSGIAGIVEFRQADVADETRTYVQRGQRRAGLPQVVQDVDVGVFDHRSVGRGRRSAAGPVAAAAPGFGPGVGRRGGPGECLAVGAAAVAFGRRGRDREGYTLIIGRGDHGRSAGGPGEARKFGIERRRERSQRRRQFRRQGGRRRGYGRFRVGFRADRNFEQIAGLDRAADGERVDLSDGQRTWPPSAG